MNKSASLAMLCADW